MKSVSCVHSFDVDTALVCQVEGAHACPTAVKEVAWESPHDVITGMLTIERLCTNHMRSAAIYEFYPDSAGKLTGMFLEATEVSLCVWQKMHTSNVSPPVEQTYAHMS